MTLGGPALPIVSALVARAADHARRQPAHGPAAPWKPFDPDDVATLQDLFAAGKVKPAIDRRYPLAEIVDALRYVDERRSMGKVVITV